MMINHDSFSLIRQSVVGNTMTDDDKQLEKVRITSNKDIPPIDFLIRKDGIPCFPRGEIDVVSGKAKSGKTTFLSMLMACCTSGEALEMQRPFDDIDGDWVCRPIRVLWYDTEQSEQSTQDILCNRILKLAPAAEQFLDVFNVRCLRCEERLKLFVKAVTKYQPDLVVLDGVRDLIADINDGVKAQELVENLMTLAQSVKCCIVCVLHQNKSAEDRNPRGWIGTELLNKSFEVYSCEKLKPEGVFVVEQTLTRKYEWDKLMSFRMDLEKELPVSCDVPTRYGAERKSENNKLMNREYLDFDENGKPCPRSEELFYEVLKTGPMFYSDLQKKVQHLLNCETNMWNKMFCEMRDRGYIVKSTDQNGKSVWKLPSRAGQGDSPSS